MSDLHKIIIFEISDNRIWRSFFPYCSGVHWVNVNNDYSSFPADYGFESISLIVSRDILEASVNREPYRKVDTLEETIGNTAEKTFYYDSVTGNLYIHFEDHRHPYTYAEGQISLGFSNGFMRSSSGWDGITDSQQYRERLEDSSLFSDAKDDPYSSLQSFQETNAVLYNGDFALSPFSIGPGVSDRTRTYARVRMYSGPTTDNIQESDFELISQNIVKAIEEGPNIFIDLIDVRSDLTEQSPTRLLDPALYPDLSDTDKEYVIPEAWGKLYGVKPLCLNESANKDITGAVPSVAGGDDYYKYLLCDATVPKVNSNRNLGTSPISTIYLEGTPLPDEYQFGVGADQASISVENGVHILNVSQKAFRELRDSGEFSRKGMGNLTVDFEGYVDGSNSLIENSMEILENIIYDNYSWPVNTTFYDLDTWNLHKADAVKVGYYFDAPTTVQEKTEMVSSDNLDNFIWDKDLKFSWDTDDFLGYDFTLTDDEFIGEDFVPSVKRTVENLLATFRIGYRPKQDESKIEQKYTWSLDDTYKDTALANYRSTLSRDFPTNMTDPTEVEALKTRIHTISDIPEDVFSAEIPWKYLKYKAGDWCRLRVNLPQRHFLGWTRAKVLRVEPNLRNYTTQITFRIFEYHKNLYVLGEKAVYNGIDLLKGD